MDCIAKEIRPLVTTPIKKELEKAKGLADTMPDMAKRAQKLTETLEAIEALPDCGGKGRKGKAKQKRPRTPYGQHLSDCFKGKKTGWLQKNPNTKMEWDDIQKLMKECRGSWKKKGA